MKANPSSYSSLKLVAAAVLGGAVALGGGQLLGLSSAYPHVVTLERHVGGQGPASSTLQVVRTATGRAIDTPAGMLDFTLPAEKATPGVVHINATFGKAAVADRRSGAPQSPRSGQGQSPQGDPFGDQFREFFEFRGPQQQQGPQKASGSGVIISAEGYIVTNNHVVENASDIEVVLSDKRTAKAKLIGRDPSTDLAVLQIRETDLKPLAFGNSDEVKTGQWVIAVGNPFNLESTVTAGVISAKGRNIRILQDSMAIESFIQTDAAVNPGNSGGALVNLNGDLIGINTAIASPTGAFAGYAFAVPSNIVNKVVEDLIRYGVVQRGLLGVQINEVNPQLAREKDLKTQDGVYVGGVGKNSAGDAAGLKEGDVILKVDQALTNSVAALQEQIARRRPGDKVSLLINRRGETKTVEATLRSKAGNTEVIRREVDTEGVSALGLELAEPKPADLKKAGLSSGIRVAKIKPGLVADQTDMREGFIITKVDKKPIKSLKEAREALKAATTGGILVEGLYPDYPGTQYYAFGKGE